MFPARSLRSVLALALALGVSALCVWLTARGRELASSRPDGPATAGEAGVRQEAPVVPDARPDPVQRREAGNPAAPAAGKSAQAAAPAPAVEPLRLGLQEGDRLAFAVCRSRQRAGRFEGGDTTWIDYALRVKELAADGSLELEATLERIRFERAGRAPIALDTASRQDREPPLVAALRDVAGKPLRVTVGPRGQVERLDGFPQPRWRGRRREGAGARVQPGPAGDGAESPGPHGNHATLPESLRRRGLEGAERFERVASLLLRFVVSPEVVQEDLHAILAAGLQGRALHPGRVYRLEPPRSLERRRRRHPGPVPIQPGADRETGPNPLSGTGNAKGLGEFALRFAGLDDSGRSYEFELLQAFGPREVPVADEAHVVGRASYRREDGLLERLRHDYRATSAAGGGGWSLEWKIDITRK